MESPPEFLVGREKCGFGIDIEMTAEIDHGKEQVAIFFLDIGAILRGHRFFQFGSLFRDLVEDRCGF